MESMRNQNAHTLTVCPRPGYKNNKENFRSVKFRDSPIIVLGISDERDDNEPSYTDSTHPLVLCKNKNISYGVCRFCRCLIDYTTEYYLCEEFDQTISETYTISFHKECIEPIKKNPYHPKHSLQVFIFDNVTPKKVCYCCYLHKECIYYCFICNFSICRDCTTKPVLLTIDHKKRHEHKLSYFRREASMICDVCSLDDRRYFIYVCQQCDFVVHKECIYSPHIIKITRHEHRLSFSSSFRHGEWFCGICRKKVDENYGGYSCVKGCYYAAHSKCVVHEDVWDGKELEEEPEEIYEDITPFKEITDGVIQHFSHKHRMKLHKGIDKTNKDNKHCQACTLSIYNGNIFSCMECDFVLHKVCAFLPVKKQYVMHRHPLILQEGNINDMFLCSACNRLFNGFRYICQKVNCDFILDMNCATVSEPLSHPCHPHLLFLPSKPGSSKVCSICRILKTYRVDCEKCEFVSCFSCAIIPMEFRYKHDEHPLILSYEQSINNQHLCDYCEREIYPKNGIYMCNECDIGLHIECLFGRDMYLLTCKALFGKEGDAIIPNNRLTRYICTRCNQRCERKIFFKISNKTICSLECLFEKIRH